jgi:hypothetical protein
MTSTYALMDQVGMKMTVIAGRVTVRQYKKAIVGTDFWPCMTPVFL